MIRPVPSDPGTMGSLLRFTSRLIQALLLFLLQSLLVLAASGAIELPLAFVLRWLGRHAHVASLRHVLLTGGGGSHLFASGVWVAAQLCLLVHALRSLRSERTVLGWGVLALPLLVVLYVALSALVLAGAATFVANAARAFLSEVAALWAGVISAVVLSYWLVLLGWAELPAQTGQGRR